jgi:ribosome biogenesis GTPase / thiamine phosphate phosphatase
MRPNAMPPRREKRRFDVTMIQIDFPALAALGLTPMLAQRATAHPDRDDPDSVDDLRLMRIGRIHRDAVRVHDGTDEHAIHVLPRLERDLKADDTALAVGDWVLCGTDAYGDYRVHARVPPASSICRRDADGRSHAVVCNVDTALLVMGLDDDFNPRRLERYLALAAVSVVEPVVVLTKADVAAATPGLVDARLAALHGRVPRGTPLLAVDATAAATASMLGPWLGAGRTLVMLGSSGAGKSTLTNTLLGTAAQDTGAVRGHDGRGKHTTTARSLHRLSGGACVIDTPGLRTLRADVDDAVLATVFDDVAVLAARCRFRDCRHALEPGCAVREGVATDRLQNFRKLLREAGRDTLSPLQRQRRAAVWKQRAEASRARAKPGRESS